MDGLVTLWVFASFYVGWDDSKFCLDEDAGCLYITVFWSDRIRIRKSGGESGKEFIAFILDFDLFEVEIGLYKIG